MSTLCVAFARTVAAHPDEPALSTADGAVEWTWREYAERVQVVAAGLAGLGVRRCDTVALWLAERPEFHVADTAALHLGAAPFSIDSAFGLAQVEHVIGDAGSRVLITEPAFLDRALEIRARGFTALEVIVLVEDEHAHALSWEQLLAASTSEVVLGAYPDDLVTLVYTSGGAGLPVAVELTHVDVLAQIAALRCPEGRRALSRLPAQYLAERLVAHYLPLARHGAVTCPVDVDPPSFGRVRAPLPGVELELSDLHAPRTGPHSLSDGSPSAPSSTAAPRTAASVSAQVSSTGSSVTRLPSNSSARLTR